MPNLYRTESYYPRENAQRNLTGRTHYVDDDTLRWHKAKVLSTAVVDRGLLFALVESVALDIDNTRRGFRFAVFDIFGHVISRVDLENSWRTRDQATKAMWAYLNTIDAGAITLASIERERAVHDREMTELTQIVAERPAA
jgi:hypothetical protein